jgi:hypothetical protein
MTELTRKQLLAGAAATAVGATGIYELVDRLASSPDRAASAPPKAGHALPAEQHLLHDVRVVVDNGAEVLVPPLHHMVVTARVKPERAAELKQAQAALAATLHELDMAHPATPAGLGVTVAWGLPWFRRLPARLVEAHLPVDRRASKSKRRPTPALLDAIRFPSDPAETLLDENDLAVLLRSDSLERIEAARKALFDGHADTLEVTSIRRGFAGGGFDGGIGLPKKMALAAGVEGAELIPDGAELFLGFTSTLKANLGPSKIANLETLGYADLRSGYFLGGTAMHLSHIREDLADWYLNFDYGRRVETTFRPGLDVEEGTQTVPQGPDEVATKAHVALEFHRSGVIGHSASIQTASRLLGEVVGPDGTVYKRGTAIPQRADFNTLDDPFHFSIDPARDGLSGTPAAGVHFVVFNPTSDDFHRNRLAMDGHLPDGTVLKMDQRSEGQGFNAVLRTTHRQNFLVPPRAHRALPLAELL